MLLQSACGAYGFRDRPDDARAVQGTTLQAVRFAGVRAPAARHIDVRLANAHLSEKLQASCPDLALYAPDDADTSPDATLSCLATAHRSRGAAHALWANVTLECEVQHSGSVPRRVSSTGKQMLSPVANVTEELSSSALASSQQMADTDALLNAIARLPCPTL